MSQFIQLKQTDKVLKITIDRSALKNALNHEMYDALASAINAAEKDESIRVMVVTGAGDIFTAGNDLEDFMNPMPEGTWPVFKFLKAISEASKPIIGAVNGPAIGIGVTMLLHFDLAYASSSASFRAAFAHVGVVPEAASSYLLSLTVGRGWANEMFLAGRVLAADEALQAGLITRVFAPEELLQGAMAVAHEIASLAPNAVLQSKKLVKDIHREKVAQQMRTEAEIFEAQLASEEFTESVNAFLQKRPARFD